MLAQAHFSAERLHRVDSATMLRLLLDEKGVDWNDCPPFFKWGTYIKKEEFDKPAFNPKTQQEVRAHPAPSPWLRAACSNSLALPPPLPFHPSRCSHGRHPSPSGRGEAHEDSRALVRDERR
eukprot:4426175-Prymnesium_polylepis.1